MSNTYMVDNDGSSYDWTIYQVLMRAGEMECDRVCVISSPTENTPAAFVILLWGNEAISSISPVVWDRVSSLPDPKGQYVLRLKLGDHVKFIPQWLADNEVLWRQGDFEFQDRPVRLFAILGTDICKDLAPRLTALGCPAEL